MNKELYKDANLTIDNKWLQAMLDIEEDRDSGEHECTDNDCDSNSDDNFSEVDPDEKQYW